MEGSGLLSAQKLSGKYRLVLPIAPIVLLTIDSTNAISHHLKVPIILFKYADTKRLFEGHRVRRFINIEGAAMRKLAMLNRAGMLADLQIPPGNRLEALKGSRVGQYSIRINDKFRICFIWTEEGPKDVEIVDYH
jgi:toxin HigB-1